jgi:hypothetical protein
MENLIIKHKTQAISRKVIGGFWILLAIIFLFSDRHSPEEREWLRPIMFFIMGVIFFTPLIGSAKSQIEISEGYLKIIWINWIKTITIQESEIEKIVLASDGVIIYRKVKKPVKIFLYGMKKEQKNKVHKFFAEYTQQKNFVLGI